MRGNKNRRKIFLASSSPRRRMLLDSLGISYKVVLPRVREVNDSKKSATKLVIENARLKARDVAGRLESGIVIAADTIVSVGRHRFNKPGNKKEALSMLKALGGRIHTVFTGLYIIDIESGKHFLDVSKTKVKLRNLGPKQALRYLESMRPLDKAGSYAAQDARSMIIDKVYGSLSNVVGLPLDLLEKRLKSIRAI